ncbi:hypothetical protein ACI796_10980 [Geodermatophilus sp. SYSU D00525]
MTTTRAAVRRGVVALAAVLVYLLGAVVALGCVAVLAWFLGPTSEALISRQMD